MSHAPNLGLEYHLRYVGFIICTGHGHTNSLRLRNKQIVTQKHVSSNRSQLCLVLFTVSDSSICPVLGLESVKLPALL